MLLRIPFLKAAKPVPRVVVNLADDDPTRGDSHGYVGIAKLVAEKLGTNCDIFDTAALERKYPEHPNNKARILKEFNEHGYPSIYFNVHAHDNELEKHGTRITINRYNEGISSEYGREGVLVAHHITPELLKSEGQKFKSRYRSLKKPIIALMMPTNGGFLTHRTLLMKGIINTLEEGTIFVCAGRRASQKEHRNIQRQLRAYIKEQGRSKNIFVSGSHVDDLRDSEFEAESQYNPYIGLIDQASHILLYGSSRSMLSEPLIAGKPVHVLENITDQEKLVKRGLVKTFETFSNPELSDDRFEPVNLTDRIASNIVKHYHLRKYLHPWKFMF